MYLDLKVKWNHQDLRKIGKDQEAEKDQENIKLSQNEENYLNTKKGQTAGRYLEGGEDQVVMKEDHVKDQEEVKVDQRTNDLSSEM